MSRLNNTLNHGRYSVDGCPHPTPTFKLSPAKQGTYAKAASGQSRGVHRPSKSRGERILLGLLTAVGLSLAGSARAESPFLLEGPKTTADEAPSKESVTTHDGPSTTRSNLGQLPNSQADLETPPLDGLRLEIEALEAKGVLPILDQSSDLPGVDEDKNGIRDDIDAVLEQLPVDDSARAAVVQLAQSLQSALIVDIDHNTALNEAMLEVVDAVTCLGTRVEEDTERANLLAMLEGMTANTRERTVAYIAYNKALSGRVSTMPDRDTCDAPSFPIADEPPLCRELQAGYVVGFFNGVLNTHGSAMDSLNQLKNALGYGKTYNQQPIRYELFYNQSSGWDDFVETFGQFNDVTGGQFDKRWSAFWEAARGRGTRAKDPRNGGPLSFLDVLIDISVSGFYQLQALLDRLTAFTVNAVTKSIGHFTANPPTQADIQRHTSRIQSLAVDGVKMLLVAHSQGNMFVNHAYTAAIKVPGYTKASIGVVHVAPPHDSLKGNHSLTDKDVIINSLRASGPFAIAESNVTIPEDHLLLNDHTGHGFLETYLKKGLAPRKQILGFANSTLKGLSDPPNAAAYVNELFKVTLMWASEGDMDLHATEPDQRHVFFANRKGASGELIIDNRSGFGPEIYRVPCDEDKTQVGEYEFSVTNFAGVPRGTRFLLQIASRVDGVVYTDVRRAHRPIGGQVGQDALDVVRVFKMPKIGFGIQVDPLIVDEDVDGIPFGD